MSEQLSEISVLFKAFESLNYPLDYTMVSLIDIKMLLVDENYSKAAQQVNLLCQQIAEHNPEFRQNDKYVDVLAMLHNAILDKNKDFQKRLLHGLFKLIQKNLELAGVKSRVDLFDLYGKMLDDKHTYDSFVELIQLWQRKVFKHKEATIAFAKQCLVIHQQLSELDYAYL